MSPSRDTRAKKPATKSNTTESNRAQDELNAKTSQLKELIKTAESSGAAAWDAGELFSYIRQSEQYKVAHKTFATYCNNALRISQSKAYDYIRIHESFQRADISDKTLVTHLKLLQEMVSVPNIRRTILKVMKGFESTAKGSSARNATVPYTTDDLRELANLLVPDSAFSDGQQLSIPSPTDEAKASRLFASILKREAKKKAEERRLAKQPPTITGSPLDSPAFPNVKRIFANMPVDEAGVVALFCTMFHLLNSSQLSFELNGVELQFAKIHVVRAKFPDAVIVCREVSRTSRYQELQIEFEFFSSNYLRHRHHQQGGVTCHLIICWEHDMSTEAENNWPPVLALRELLTNGEIVLRGGRKEHLR